MALQRPARRRANATIEFAFWLPILLTMTSGLMDYVWYMTRYTNVARAARDGARIGATVFEGEDVTPGDIVVPETVAQTKAILDLVNMPCEEGCDVTAEVTFLPFRAVEVEINYPFQPIFGYMPVPDNLYARFILASDFQ